MHMINLSNWDGKPINAKIGSMARFIITNRVIVPIERSGYLRFRAIIRNTLDGII